MLNALGLAFATIFVTTLTAQDFTTDLRKTTELLVRAQDRDRETAESLETLKSKRQRLEEDLADAQENPKLLSKKSVDSLEKQVKILRKQENDALAKRKEANYNLIEISDVLKADPKRRAKFIASFEKKNGALDMPKLAENQLVTEESRTDVVLVSETQSAPAGDVAAAETPIVSPSAKPKNSEKKKEKKQRKSDTAKAKTPAENAPPSAEAITQTNEVLMETVSEKPDIKSVVKLEKPVEKPSKKKADAAKTTPSVSLVSYRNYDPKEDVMLNPPTTSECRLVFDGIDNFTGKKKRETAPVVLFTHTEDFMREAFKDKDYVVCEVSASRVEGSRVIYLNMTFTILSKEAQRVFGFLDKGAPIVFRFINGLKLPFQTTKTDIGTVDLERGTTTYHAQIGITDPIDLQNSELDIVRMPWSAGYEDYEIFDLDVLRNLFRCLDKK